MKNSLPLAIQKAVRCYEPIELGGITYHPIRMDEADELEMVKPAAELMLSRLPAPYAVMPFLAAVYAYDYDLLRQSGTASGLFSRTVLFLCLCLRLGRGEPPEKRVARMRIVTDRKDPRALKALEFLTDGEEAERITPRDYARARPVLAAQNGLTLQDEAQNVELLDAAAELREASGGARLHYDLDELIAAVAAESGVDEGELLQWPVLKFQRRKEAIDRRLRFLVCGIGEAAGGRYKGGNPCPSWCFRREEGSGALIPMQQFLAGAGAAAENRTDTGGTP